MGELNFGYNAKTVVYTNSSSDIPKLSEIGGVWLMETPCLFHFHLSLP